MSLACEDDHQIEAHKVVLADVSNKIIFLKMLVTLEPLVLQRSHAPQNDHKSKNYLLPKGQGLFTSEKSDIGAYIRLWHQTSYQTFQNQTAHPYVSLI